MYTRIILHHALAKSPCVRTKHKSLLFDIATFSYPLQLGSTANYLHMLAKACTHCLSHTYTDHIKNRLPVHQCDRIRHTKARIPLVLMHRYCNSFADMIHGNSWNYSTGV